MRVTAGIYKGRKLLENKYNHIRPTADMVKQALFNKLSTQILNARFLDLFCGSGAIGIEAISRGAKEVIFVDKDNRSTNLTKQNLKKLSIQAKVLTVDYKKALQSFKGEKFDIIFIDPPYKSEVYNDALQLIFNLSLLEEGGVIICEQEKSYKINQNYFEQIDEKSYGIKKLVYFANKFIEE